MLHGIRLAQQTFIRSADRLDAFDRLTDTLVDVTGSTIGFIAEMLQSPEGDPYLLVHSLTPARPQDGEARFRPPVQLHDLNTLPGQVAKSGRPLIVNQMPPEAMQDRLPEGHPPIRRFMGAPLIVDGIGVGIVSVANSPEPYDIAMLQALEPLLATCSHLILALRSERVRERAEEQLRQNQALLKTILDVLPQGVFWKDRDGRLLGGNRRWREDIGRVDPVGLTDFDITTPAAAEAFRAWDQRVMQSGRAEMNITETLPTGSGETRWLSMSKVPLHDRSGAIYGVLGTYLDITELKRTEQALRSSEQRYELSVAGSNDVIFDADMSTGRLFVSPRLAEILGIDVAALPQTVTQFEALVHPDDVRRTRAARVAHFKDDRPLDIEVRLRTGQGHYRWFRGRGLSLRDERGRAARTAGSFTDITDYREALAELAHHRDNLQQLIEQRTVDLEEALDEAERAARAKSEFLANMSHELRTPMHAILSFARLGMSRVENADREKLAQYFRNITSSGDRLLTLLNELLDLAKLEAGKMVMNYERTEIGGLIEQAVAENSALAMSRQVRLVARADSDGCVAVVDPMRLMQVLNNLLSNALKFSPEQAQVVLAYGTTDTHDTEGEAVPAVAIRVIDQGIGIPPDELDAVFDKFVQSSKTKSGAGGTGLGLAICREILRAHRGTVTAANNADGPGATFTLVIPAERRPDPPDR